MPSLRWPKSSRLARTSWPSADEDLQPLRASSDIGENDELIPSRQAAIAGQPTLRCGLSGAPQPMALRCLGRDPYDGQHIALFQVLLAPGTASRPHVRCHCLLAARAARKQRQHGQPSERAKEPLPARGADNGRIRPRVAGILLDCNLDRLPDVDGRSCRVTERETGPAGPLSGRRAGRRCTDEFAETHCDRNGRRYGAGTHS